MKRWSARFTSAITTYIRPLEYLVLPAAPFFRYNNHPQVHFPAMSPTEVRAAVSNGIPVPDLDLPVRDSFNVDIQFDVALALSVPG